MKIWFLVCTLALASCARQEAQDQLPPSVQADEQIQALVSSLYEGLERAYNEGSVSPDSLVDAYYAKGIRYVTPWGWTEPIDSTKARLRNAAGHVRNYRYQIEAFKVKSFGNGAYAFFVLRQSSEVNGVLLDEYLPTTLILERSESGWKIVHVHRSTDYETFQQYVAMQKKTAK